jgi:hypothetical protein
LKALCRFLLPNFTATASEPSASGPKTVESQIQLTKEQVEEAKKEAKVAKAKRIGNGVTPRDVALTPPEIKEAKAAFRRKLQSGAGPVINRTHQAAPVETPPSKKGEFLPEVKASHSLPSEKDVEQPSSSLKKKVGVQLAPSGARKTHKTRIDNCRKVALQHNPAALAEPTLLHVVAYCNDFVRLSNQVESYSELYELSGMMNPLRGLPTPTVLGTICKDLNEVLQRLQKQSDSSGTYVLQSQDGGSFWNQDKPSTACPEFLRRPLEGEVKLILDLSGASN